MMMVEAKGCLYVGHYFHRGFIRKAILQKTVIVVPTNEDHRHIAANRD